MDLEQAFLADVVANPNDPTPWLIFADWLEERDDPRGELVRLWQQTRQAPEQADLSEQHARLEALFAAGLRLPLPRHTNALGMEFVWVPPGAFWMGGGDGKCGDKLVEMPQAFYLGVYPVTQGQWQALLGSNPSHFKKSGAELDQFPVESVSWNDVQEFLTRLNKKESGEWMYRLPTKAEWEYSVRSPVPSPASSAAAQTHCGFSFYLPQPSNSLSSEQANFNGNYPASAAKGRYLKATSKVGSYPGNRLGICDLHGNVWEWMDTPEGGVRVIRGGSWLNYGSDCTAASRLTLAPGDRAFYLGFRLARVLSGQQ